MLHHALIMLAAGIGIPILAALNAALGRTIGSPAVAATILFVVAFASAAIVALLTNPQAFAKLAGAPKHLFFAGVLIAFMCSPLRGLPRPWVSATQCSLCCWAS